MRHFIRARLNEKGEPFACGHPTMSMDDTWGKGERARPWCRRQECSSRPPSLELIVTRRVGTPVKTLVRKSGRALPWRWPFVKSEEIVARCRRQFQVLELARTSSGARRL